MTERLKKGFTFLIAILAMVMLVGNAGIYAADSSVTVSSVDYTTSTITVKMGSADTALYISDGKQKKWEYIPVEKDSEGCVAVDFSWIVASTNYTISFKGDASTEPVKIVIPKQETKFKATYSALNGGSISFANDGGRRIEWKKRDALRWNSFPSNASEFQSTLYSLCSNGAVLMFRLAPVNGNQENPGLRPSKEVLVTVKKKAVAPTVRIDDAKMAIPVTKGLEYRYCDKDGNPMSASWTTITKKQNMPLSSIAGKSVYDATTNPSPEDTYIQFRTAATSTAQISNSSTLKIPAQEPLAADFTGKAKIEYTSKSSLKLSVSVAGPGEPYEYCIINQNDIRDGIKIDDVEKVTWKEINSPSAITISRKNDGVDDGSLIYVRRKAYKSSGDEEYRLASNWILLGSVNYPGDISTNGGKLIWLSTIAGVCNPDNSDGFLTFSMYSPSKNEVADIQFYNYESETTAVGNPLRLGDDFKCVVTDNEENDGNPDKAYIITVTITSTAKIDTYASNENNRKLLAGIKLKDSSDEAFKSSASKGGIALYIYPMSKINNPKSETLSSDKIAIANLLKNAGYTSWNGYSAANDHVEYTTSFERIIGSDRVYVPGSGTAWSAGEFDANTFRIRIDTGTRFEPDRLASGELSTTRIAVDKIRYDGVDFAVGEKNSAGEEYFTVEYADITGSGSSAEQRMALITIKADAIEKNPAVTTRNELKPVTVYLSNGETISDAKMKLVNTVTPKDGAVSINFIEKEIQEKEVTKVTKDGVTTVTETDLPDKYSIEFNVFDKNYVVGCIEATWMGHDIISGVSTSGGVMKVTFSNKKLNQIDVASTQTGSVRFVFDNGFVLETGCKITVTASN